MLWAAHERDTSGKGALSGCTSCTASLQWQALNPPWTETSLKLASLVGITPGETARWRLRSPFHACIRMARESVASTPTTHADL
jgi:hypothetical protein